MNAFEELAIAIATEAAKKVGIQLYQKISKTRYGKLQLLLFLVMDFLEPVRVDNWEIKIRDILTEKGAKKENNEYVVQEVIRIKDISNEFLPFANNEIESETELMEGKKSEEEILEDSILLVKRSKIYAVPDSQGRGSVVKAAVFLAELFEEFMKIINPKKTFVGLKLSFDEPIKSNKFKVAIEKNFRANGLSGTYVIYHEENTMQLIVNRPTKIESIFRIVDNEIYGGFLRNLRNIF